MASIELRAAAQQALEACKLIVSAFDALKPASAARNEPLQINAARASITALEAALAEPVQEPVAWWKRHRDGSVELNDARTFIAADALATGRRPLVFGDAAPPQRPAEPVQEPVARSLTEDERAAIEYFALNPSMAVLAFSHWLRRDKSAPLQRPAEPVQEPFGYFRAEPFGWTDCAATDEGAIPLYTRPPAHQPLTVARLRDALVSARIVPPAAVEDPDGYDDGVTLHRIEALHRRLA